MKKLIKFEKYSATGNDFILINTDSTELFTPAVIKQLCDRKLGIGSDGILFFTPLRGEDDYRMTFFNPDGSPAAMCGNGARAMLAYAGRYFDRTGLFRFKVGERRFEGKITPPELSINMGTPKFIDIAVDDLVEDGQLARCIDSGVPYVVILTDNIDNLDIGTKGSLIRRDKRFAMGTNVIFLEKKDNNFYARIFERGVEGETLSSGTGATAISFFINQCLNESVEQGVKMPGGRLYAIEDANNHYWLKGSVMRVFSGEFWL